MKVYLDSQEYLELSPSADAISVLEAIRSEVTRTGRVITEIKVDGISMDETAFSSITGGLAVYFSSQPVRELISESLSEALHYLPRLQKGLEDIAINLEGNELSHALSKLADAAEGLDWCLTVFWKSSALLAFTPDEGSEGLTELKEALADSINLLGTLNEEKKYLQMALCIRQSLLPAIQQFAIYINKLHELSASIQ